MYERTIEKSIKESLFKGKIVIIYGPRQVGKTTLSKKILSDSGVKSLYIQADIASSRDLISRPELVHQQRQLNGTWIFLKKCSSLQGCMDFRAMCRMR